MEPSYLDSGLLPGSRKHAGVLWYVSMPRGRQPQPPGRPLRRLRCHQRLCKDFVRKQPIFTPVMDVTRGDCIFLIQDHIPLRGAGSGRRKGGQRQTFAFPRVLGKSERRVRREGQCPLCRARPQGFVFFGGGCAEALAFGTSASSQAHVFSAGHLFLSRF